MQTRAVGLFWNRGGRLLSLFMAQRTKSRQKPWYYYIFSMLQSALYFIFRQAVIWQTCLFVFGSIAAYFGLRQQSRQELPKQKKLWPWKKAPVEKVESAIDRYSAYLPALQQSGFDVRGTLYKLNTTIVDLRVLLRSLDDALGSIQRRLSAVQWRMLSDADRDEMLDMYEQRYPMENIRRKIKTRRSSPDLRSIGQVSADKNWLGRRRTAAAVDT